MFCSDKPYPSICVEKRNKDYAKLLLNDYAGEISEDFAIHQYFYQSLIINDKDISDALMQISKVEMHHLAILGKVITQLGIKPIFGTIDNNHFTPWSTSAINYSVKLKDMLIQDIKHEKDAIIKYKKHADEINDKCIKKILYRIIEDELLHIKYFYSILKKESN